MKNKKSEEMTNEELLKYEKMVKPITYILGGALALLFGINIFSFFQKGYSALSIIPIALLPILIINLSNLKEIKKEKLKRNL